MEENKSRLIFIKVVLAILAVILVVRLFYLQIIKGDQYLAMSTQRYTVGMVDKAPRGEIFDRYGKPLITNRVGYSLQLQKTDISDDELNDVLLKVIQILQKTNYAFYDTLPITSAPYEYNFSDDNENGTTDDEKTEWFKDKKKIKENMSADEVMHIYKELYKLREGYTAEEERRIIGMRYEATLRGFSLMSPLTLAEDIDINIVTEIKERQSEFPGVVVVNDYIRNYDQGTLAAHILGRVGKISKEEYDANKDKGYGYNDVIGKQGIEKIAEDNLRGTDGTKGIESNINGNIVTLAQADKAVPGNYVMLTIDSDLQRVAEQSLAANIDRIRKSGGDPSNRKGGDCSAGAAVVIDVKNGDVLAMATYPTYDPSRFNEDYTKLYEDKNKPMWNRALSGTYTPGSTFKPLTAIAALESGVLGVNEIIEDLGVYTFYNDYQPRCWIWTEQHRTHGKINVSGAIEGSCNYFFYEVGRRLGIEKIDEYAKKFGLGELTGIQLTEEAKGNVASPEYKARINKSAEDKKWYGGDTIQAAIGQSIHQFTPIQIANYAATIANGGTRYKTNIIKNIRSTVDGSIIEENTPEVVESIKMRPEVLSAVKNGMKRVVDEGSASSVFDGYPIAIGGKTGTAQVSKKATNNAVFMAFAPFDEPEIAIAVVLEHGLRGANAGYVAKDIMDEYFKLNTTGAAVPEQTADDVLLP